MECANIIYLNINKFLPSIDRASLNNFSEKDYKSEKRKIQHALGRFLINYISIKYNLNNPKILIKNNKPVFQNNELYFSLSHTKNIVAIAFGENNIGLDIEFMQDRNFSKYFERYKIHTNSNDKISFYKFWTKYEAEIKLQEKIKSFYTFEITKDFMCTICTANELDIQNNLNIQELVLTENPNNELTDLETLITNKNLSKIQLIHHCFAQQ